MKIVVVVPTYNEKENISKMIPLLEEEIFSKIKEHAMHILVVDDFSPDGTADEVQRMIKKWKNIALLSGEKKGLGYAYVRGMQYAMNEMKADAVMEFDADFQHDPYDIPRLITAMDEGADYIIGSRYIKGGSIPKEWGINRKILSVFGNLFTRIAWWNFSIHDMTSGFKLTKTKHLSTIDLNHLLSNNFAYKMQILHDIVKQGVNVKEVPIVFRERETGASKISQKDQFESFYVVLRLGMYKYKRFIKFLFVGGSGFLVQIIMQEMSIRTGLTIALAQGFDALMGVHHANLNPLSQSIGAAIGAEAAILSNFFLNNYWTFQDTRSMKHRTPGFVRLFKFNMTSFGAILIQSLAVWIGIKTLGDTVRIMMFAIPTRIIVLFPTIILFVIPLNYLIYNKIIWKTHKLKHAS